MAERFTSPTSNLLCSEDRSTCFHDDGLVGQQDHTNVSSDHHCLSQNNHGSEPFAWFMVQSDETVRVMVEKERGHLPRDDYLKRLRSGELDLSVRREALDWIWKVCLLVFSNGVLFDSLDIVHFCHQVRIFIQFT